MTSSGIPHQAGDPPLDEQILSKLQSHETRSPRPRQTGHSSSATVAASMAVGDVNNRPPQPPLSRPHATLPSISSRPLLLPQAETMPNPSYPPLAHTTAGTSPAAPGGVSQTVGRFPFLLMSSVGFPNHQTDALQSPPHVTEPNSNATQTLLAAACGGISLPATFHYVHPSSDYHASTLQLLSRVTTNLNAPHVASALPWSSSHMN